MKGLVLRRRNFLLDIAVVVLIGHFPMYATKHPRALFSADCDDEIEISVRSLASVHVARL
jgi:hypothetical protein